MKNKFLAAVLIIILFIPTVLAFVSYNPPFDKLTDNSSLIVSAELETPMGEKIDITDKETIKALSALLKGEQVDAIPDEAFRYNSFKTTLKGDGITEEYSVYMNVEKLEDIYFYNNDDKTPYRAKAENGRNFASLDLASFLYTYDIPVLTVGNGTVITPSVFSWKYRNIKGDYVDSTVPTTNEIADIGRVSAGDLGILFSRKPQDTDVYITMTEDDGTTATRPFNEFSGVYPDTETAYTFKIDVQWREEDGSTGVGSGSYTFRATVKASPSFNIWTTMLEHTGQPFVEKGGLIIVGGMNIDPSKVEFSSSPSLDVTPKFYTDGDSSYAVIPTTYKTEAGKYTVTLKHGAISSTYDITVVDKEYNTKEIDVKKSTLEEYITDANISALKTLMGEIMGGESSSKWLGEKEILFPTRDQSYITGYGNPIKFNGEESPYVHAGIESRLYKGSYATAMASGKIAYVGEDTLFGGFIVVDHGLGIRSWYTRLDITGINVGDEVTQGQKLAPNDGSGFGETTKRLFSAVSVGDTFVSPTWLIENGFELPTS